MQIGELARQAGVSTQTIRFYERVGLIKCPARTRAGYRTYPKGFVQVVRFIKQSKDLGYTLAEIRDVLALRDEGVDTGRIRSLAAEKLKSLDQQIVRLTEMRNNLEAFVIACTCGTKRRPNCPAITVLDFNAPCCE